MSLAKSVEFVLSIAACGGVVLALGGAAYAAEPGVDTTKPAAQVDNSLTNKSPIKPPASDQPEAVTTTQTQDPTTESSSVSTPVVEQTTIDAEKAALPADAKLTETAAVAEPVVTSTEKKTEATPGRGEVATNPVMAPATITVNMPVVETASAVVTEMASGAPAVVRPAVLTIQPKITTSNPVINTDLAATVPSAPDASQEPGKVPAPLQPFGLIGQLTATLAGSVVPSWLLLPAIDTSSAAAAMIVLLAAGLLVLGRRVSFVAWLRKSGYAHAARSDVADNFLSSFATQLRMGYVPAYELPHSPFLVVSDMKIATLFPTLSERRKLTCL